MQCAGALPHLQAQGRQTCTVGYSRSIKKNDRTRQRKDAFNHVNYLRQGYLSGNLRKDLWGKTQSPTNILIISFSLSFFS